MRKKSNSYKKLNLNMSKGKRMEKTDLQFDQAELHSSSVPQKPLQT